MVFDTRVTSFRGMARGMGPTGNFGLAPTWQGGGNPALLADAVRQAPINFTAQQTQVAPQAAPPINPASYQPGIDSATQEGTSTAPATGIQGLARVGQALLAAKMRGGQMQAQLGQQQYQGDAVAKALAAYQSGNVDGAIQIATQAGLGPVVQALMAQRFAPPDYQNVPEVGLVKIPRGPGGAPEVAIPAVPKAPETRTRDLGDQSVSETFNRGTQAWDTNGYSPRQLPPQGYDQGPDGLTPTKGGPADPATIERNANAGRDPLMVEPAYNPATQSVQTVATLRADALAAAQHGGSAVVGQGAPNEQVQRNAKLAVEGQNATKAAVAAIIKPDGTIDRATVDTMFANFPGSQGRQARAQFDTALANLVYIKSGAQAGPAEIASARAQYFPSPLDNDQQVRDKVTRLQAFFASAIPGGQAAPAADTVANPAAAGNDDVQQKATQAWGAYEPNRYDYRVGPNGNLQRKPK